MIRIDSLPLMIALFTVGCTSKVPSTPSEGSATSSPLDEDGDGYFAGEGSADDDCDDADDQTHPSASELCDGVDNDCDGEIDDGVQQTFYADEDGDGLGDAAAPIEGCQVPEGAVSNADDCDDAEATVYPDAEELCDGLDNDCDGTVDGLEVRYDAFDDFDVANNPSGEWRHGWSATIDGELQLFDTIDLDVLPGLVVWRGDEIQPRTVYNPTGETVTYDWGGIMPADQIVLHPGSAGEFVAAEWTAPYPGVCDLSVAFTDSDVATTDVHVLKNTVAIWDEELEAEGSTESWSSSVTVAAGDALRFTLGYGANMTYFDDSTSLDATLSCVFTCE